MSHTTNENLLLFSSKYLKQRAYWEKKLNDCIQQTELFNYSYNNDFKPDSFTITIPNDLTKKILALSNNSDLAIYIVLLTGLKCTLHLYTDNDNITIISPVFKPKITRETLNRYVLIKDVLNTDLSFKQTLLSIRASVIEAYENQDYPVEKLVEYLSEITGFKNTHNVSKIVASLSTIHDCTVFEKIDESVAINFVKQETNIGIDIFFDKNNYEKELLEQFINHFIFLLENYLENTSDKLSNLTVLPDIDKSKLLNNLNNTYKHYPNDSTLYEVFKKQAQVTPDRIAIHLNNQHITYKELEKQSSLFSLELNNKPVILNTPVAIMLDRSFEMIISVLAILKSGGTFIPIDIDNPLKRIEAIIKDANINCIITSKNIRENINADFIPKNDIIFIEELDEPDISDLEYNPVKCTKNSLAYVIYTSGSTGNPKGVLIQQDSVLNLYYSQQQQFNVTVDDKILQFSSLSFDASIEQIFLALFTGAALVLVDKATLLEKDVIESYINKMAVTHLHTVPHFLNFIDDVNYKSLKRVISGGDICNPELTEKWTEKYEFYNEYGPTETTVTSIENLIRKPVNSKNVPIGLPLHNINVYILNKDLQLLPLGVIGELYIGGKCLAKGYLNDAEKTSQRFIENHFKPGEKIYMTGDLARWTFNNTLEYYGRIDSQTKIRGFRIETGEIEYQLKQHDMVKDVIVTAITDNANEKSLCAYYIPNNEVDHTILRNYLFSVVPEYMIPAHFVALDEFPLTFTGKINKKALPHPFDIIKKELVKPGDELERQLHSMWVEILNIQPDKIGIHSNFFELGGHSLKITILASQVHKKYHVKIPITILFNDPTIENIARFIRGSVTSEFKTIKKAEKKEYYELSSAQRRLFILQQLDKKNTGYNMPQVIYQNELVDIGEFEDFLKIIVSRHESLRTSFDFIDERIVQIVHPKVEMTVECFNLNEDEVDAAIKKFIRPFDLTRKPLFRAGIINVESSYSILLVDMHHIISDGRSLDVLREEFETLYIGEELPGIQVQYKDYAGWQRFESKKEHVIKQEDFWTTIFNNEIPVLNLPTDFQRPGLQGFEGMNIEFFLNPELTTHLKKIEKQENVTLYMLVFNAFSILLSKLSGQNDIIIGTPIEGRHHADLQNVIGMFVNTLAIRTSADSNFTLKKFLSENKKNIIEYFNNKDCQFDDLVDKISINRDTSRNPIFDVLLNVIHPKEDIGTAIEEIQLKQHVENVNCKFDLELTAINYKEILFFNLNYSTKLFKKQTIERFIHYFKKVLVSFTEDLLKTLSKIEITSEEEKQRIVNSFNNTETDYPKDTVIYQLFEKNAWKNPDKIALSYQDQQITNKEFNTRVNQLAHFLIKNNVRENTIVSVLIDRSIDMMIGIFGILKAGGAYLPISPDYPPDRVEYILNDSQSGCLLVNKVVFGQEHHTTKAIHINNPLIEKEASSNPDIVPNSNNLAYIIYTSGSTGKPKGAMIAHYSLVNRINWMQKMYPISQGDVILQKTVYTFDVSVWELFWWSLYGARLHLLGKNEEKNPEKLVHAIENRNVSVIHFVPSMLNIFLEYLQNTSKTFDFSTLKYVFSSGEALATDQAEPFLKQDRIRLVNLYGPTEATIDVSYFNCTHSIHSSIVPIGKPIDNIKLLILNEHFQIQPIGIAGELYIAGDGLAMGYLNKVELTHEKFIYSTSLPYKRLYKTGDLARWLDDGNIEFLGRIDNQVKIRGFRIELGEIEYHLMKQKGVKRAIITVRKNINRSNDIVAYIVKNPETDVTEIKALLSQNLPDYMIPSYFEVIEDIPLLSNGKIDYKRLPEPKAVSGVVFVAPRNEIERKLVQLWSDLLNINESKISIYANFFEIGGNSLDIIRLNFRIKQELKKDISIVQLYNLPSIVTLTEHIIGKSQKVQIEDNLVDEFVNIAEDTLQSINETSMIK